jgi:hypothetical protein
MADWFYVGVTYGLTWAVLVAYVIHLHRTTRRAEKALDGPITPTDLKAFR